MTYRAHKLGFRIVEMPFIFVTVRWGTRRCPTTSFSRRLVNVWRLRFDRGANHA